MKIAGELDLALENLLVNCHGIVVIERVNSGDHLVSENAKCPPVDGFAVTFVEKYLGS